MNMKRKVLLPAALLCCIAASGFCTGGKDKPVPAEQAVTPEHIAALTEQAEAAGKRLTAIETALEGIKQKLASEQEAGGTPPSDGQGGGPNNQDTDSRPDSDNQGRQPYGRYNAHAAYPSRGILGRGSLSRSGVAEYTRSRNRSMSRPEIERLNQLVSLYFDEAAKENVNHDIAIAQMLHATDFLRNEYRMRTRNYAGLSEAGTQAYQWPGGRRGEFDTMRSGVRAHIQHLKGYASSAPLAEARADPRYELLGGRRGTIQDFDQIQFYSVWSPNRPYGYKADIEDILRGLYWHSDYRSL